MMSMLEIMAMPCSNLLLKYKREQCLALSSHMPYGSHYWLRCVQSQERNYYFDLALVALVVADY